MQDKHQQAISQLEKTIEDLKKELALAVRASASVAAAAAPAVPDGSSGKSKASIPVASLPSASDSTNANLNPSAPAFSVNSQFPPSAASSVAVVAPASTSNSDSVTDTESSGDKRSSENDLVGSKQTKRVLCLLEYFSPFLIFPSDCDSFFIQPKIVSFDKAPQVFTISSSSSDPVSNCVQTPHVLRVSGFPLGVSMDGEVAKALFPNQVFEVLIFFQLFI